MIGVYAQTITPALAAALRLPRDWGVVLGDVLPGSPAEKAGLRVGDIVLALDGKPMENARQLDVNLYGRPAGRKVTLQLLRGNETQAASVEVVARPDERPDLPLPSPETNLVERLGILGLNVDAKMQKLLRLRRSAGVVVAGRAADAPFGDTGLLPGDVIYAINEVAVSGVEDLRRELGTLQVYGPVVLQVERDGRLQFVAFELE
jgi:serine protease Do